VIGGRYRLCAPIGAGAMGEVWRAEHVTLGTSLALKLVDAANRSDAAELLGRFKLEAQAAAQLKSPHVVQILDHGADGHVAFIAMELLEGESLEQRLARRGRLQPTEIAHVLREMSRGLDRAHAAGIVHRDLKPPNVFIARIDGVEIVKVLDFGIAKFLGAPREAQLQTQAGFVVGTPAYMSPEQVLGKAIEHRSDLWQLAMIAFECITGTRPFGGTTLGELFMAICSAPLPRPSSVLMPGATALPPALAAFDAWFARAADRDPSRRFASAGEMAEALASAVAPGGAGEAAIPTLASLASMREAAPMGGTGRHDAWSTGAVTGGRQRTSPIAFFAGLALAPLLVISAGALWWWQSQRHVASEVVPLPHASAPPVASVPATTSPSTSAAPSAPAPSAAPDPTTSAAATAAPSGSASAAPAKPHRPRGRWKKQESDRIGL
jgi:eukaryotic-like serine/threonine-protein kinase